MHNKATPFWYLGMLAAFSLLTFDLFQPALPAITDYFKSTQPLGQLTLSLFFLVFGLSQLFWGPLIDHFGRKKTLTISLLIFICATIVCILATNIEILIIGRIFQGFAICCSHVVACSSTRDYKSNRERAKALSKITMIVSISPILAPLAGSLVFIAFGWQATFVLMIILAVFLLLICRFYMEESGVWLKTEKNYLFRNSITAYKKILSNSRSGVGISIISSSNCCHILIAVNLAYLIIDNLNRSPLCFSILVAILGSAFIAGGYLGIKFREKKPLIWNIHLGCLLMVIGSLATLLLFFIVDLSLFSLSPMILIIFGISLTNPPTFSLALAEYHQEAATATAVINAIRMSVSAVIAGLLAPLIAFDYKILAIGLLFCSLFGWLFSLFISENANAQASDYGMDAACPQDP